MYAMILLTDRQAPSTTTDPMKNVTGYTSFAAMSFTEHTISYLKFVRHLLRTLDVEFRAIVGYVGNDTSAQRHRAAGSDPSVIAEPAARIFALLFDHLVKPRRRPPVDRRSKLGPAWLRMTKARCEQCQRQRMPALRC